MRSLVPVLLLMATACGRVVEATSRGELEAARAAVASLRPELERASLSRPAWEVLTSAAAASLGPAHAGQLLSIVGDEEATPLERVAAAELFRRLSPDRHALGPAELAWLRATATDGRAGAALPSAARRVLADLGDWGDRLQLVRELETSPDPEARLVAAWCLQAAGTEQELGDLGRLLGPDVKRPIPELAAATLAAIVRQAGDGVAAEQREALVGEVLAALDAPACSVGLEQRACGLLAALGGSRARSRLELLAGEGRPYALEALGQIPE
jgi:hypothetical protein